MTEPAIRVEHLSKIYRIPIRGPTTLGGRERREDEVWEDDDEDEIVEEEPAKRPTGPTREVHALRDVSLEVAVGTRLAILGPPGAGKSTLLKILGRIVPPTAGRAVLRGRVAPPVELATSFLTPDQSGRDNAYWVARLWGIPREVVDRRIGDIFRLADLEEKIDHPAGSYSSTQYKRLGISIGLNLEPDVLLADERLVTGDPEFADRVLERLRQAAGEGLTLLFAAADEETVREFCKEAIWMEAGQVIARGPVGHVRALAAQVETPERAVRRRPPPPAESPAELPEPEREAFRLIAVEGLPYAAAASQLGVDEDEARARVVGALEALAPPGERLTDSEKALVADYMLGHARLSDAQWGRLSSRPGVRAWSRMIDFLLRRAGREDVPPFPREPSDPETGPGYEGFIPPLHPAAELLIEFLRLALGEERTREAVTMATDKAWWKDQRYVKWPDVAEAAEVDHSRAKALTEQLVEFTREVGFAARKSSEDAQILAARALGPDGEPTDVLRSDEPAGVEIELECATPDIRVRCQVALENRDGKPVRVVQPEGFVADGPGRYTVTAWLPAGLLEEGLYSGHVIAHVQAGGHESVIESKAAFALETYDATGAGEDDDSEPLEGGALVSQVDWHIRT